MRARTAAKSTKEQDQCYATGASRTACISHIVMLILALFERRCVSSAGLSEFTRTDSPRHLHLHEQSHVALRARPCMPKGITFGSAPNYYGARHLSLARSSRPVCVPRTAIPSTGWIPVPANLLVGVKSYSRPIEVPTTSQNRK
jgi:hypothetical protein